MKLDELRRDLVKPRVPTRFCQAMDDLDPRHVAEVVVTGSNGTGQWFSCKAHVPKSATRTDDIYDWFVGCGITLGPGEVCEFAELAKDL